MILASPIWLNAYISSLSPPGHLAPPQTCQSPSESGHLHLLFPHLEHSSPQNSSVLAPSPDSSLYSHVAFQERSSLTTQFKSPTLIPALFLPGELMTHAIVYLLIYCLFSPTYDVSLKRAIFFFFCLLLYRQLSGE